MAVTIKLKVNGFERAIETEPDRKLLDVLREELKLTGTKYGCGEGQCGACVVLVDGQRTHSCLRSVGAVEGKEITTVEGLAAGDRLHPVQESFIEEGAIQCGYCTSGMMITAAALLKKNPGATEEEIISAMNGNICRCNGYPKIVEAVRRASQSGRVER